MVQSKTASDIGYEQLS